MEYDPKLPFDFTSKCKIKDKNKNLKTKNLPLSGPGHLYLKVSFRAISALRIVQSYC